MRKLTRGLLVPLLLLGGAGSGCQAHDAPPLPAKASLARIPLEIKSGRQVHVFQVEVARTESEQQRGLMFRTALGVDEGMIFPFDPPTRAAFWMENTLIPLDMIFVRSDGTIARIVARAMPLSKEIVDAGEPVAAVLEIRGGRSAELGIRSGDRLNLKEVMR